MAARIRKGDKVVVISGEDKGVRGEVLRVFPKAERALVQGVNLATRHIKPQGVREQGGIRREERPLPMAKLMLVDPKSDKPTKVGFRFVGEGEQRRKVRFAKATGEAIEG